MKSKFYLATMGTLVCGLVAASAFSQTDPGMTGITGGTTPQNAHVAPGSKSTSSGKEPSGSKVVGLNGIEKATPISTEEAMGKYPPRGKTWPTAEMTSGAGAGVSTSIVPSPYPPHHKFDVSAIPRGGLVLDPYAKHVFIKP